VLGSSNTRSRPPQRSCMTCPQSSIREPAGPFPARVSCEQAQRLQRFAKWLELGVKERVLRNAETRLAEREAALAAEEARQADAMQPAE
jgi:hypothetical protein